MKKFVSVASITLLTAFGFWAYSFSDYHQNLAENEAIPQVDSAVFYNIPHLDDHKYREAQAVHKWYNLDIENYYNIDLQDKEIAELNRINDSLLNKHYGSNWRAVYQNRVDSLYTVDTMAISIAKRNKSVQRLVQNLLDSDKEKNLLIEYICRPTPVPHIKMICIEANIALDNYPERVSYIRTAVDMKTNKTISTETIAMGQLW